jgi:hypothetical protein
MTRPNLKKKNPVKIPTLKVPAVKVDSPVVTVNNPKVRKGKTIPQLSKPQKTTSRKRLNLNPIPFGTSRVLHLEVLDHNRKRIKHLKSVESCRKGSRKFKSSSV